jgi:hypothetical protein
VGRAADIEAVRGGRLLLWKTPVYHRENRARRCAQAFRRDSPSNGWNHAIGAYNINNAEQTMGLFKGCLDSEAPFIIQISKGARKYTDQPRCDGRGGYSASLMLEYNFGRKTSCASDRAVENLRNARLPFRFSQ